MAKTETETDLQGGLVGRPEGLGSADPEPSFVRLFPSFAGTLLAVKEILVGGSRTRRALEFPIFSEIARDLLVLT